MKICATHSHDFSIHFADFYNVPSKNRASARNRIHDEIKRIKNCQTFFEEYNNEPDLSLEERAAIAENIKSDQDYIETLEKIIPSSCTIS